MQVAFAILDVADDVLRDLFKGGIPTQMTRRENADHNLPKQSRQ
jgi:hypothetical protein